MSIDRPFSHGPCTLPLKLEMHKAALRCAGASASSKVFLELSRMMSFQTFRQLSSTAILCLARDSFACLDILLDLGDRSRAIVYQSARAFCRLPCSCKDYRSIEESCRPPRHASFCASPPARVNEWESCVLHHSKRLKFFRNHQLSCSFHEQLIISLPTRSAIPEQVLRFLRCTFRFQSFAVDSSMT